MAFDPDKYLAEKTAAPGGFDPDKYLQEKTGQAPQQSFMQKVVGGAKSIAKQMFPRTAAQLTDKNPSTVQSDVVNAPINVGLDVASGVGNAVGHIPLVGPALGYVANAGENFVKNVGDQAEAMGLPSAIAHPVDAATRSLQRTAGAALPLIGVDPKPAQEGIGAVSSIASNPMSYFPMGEFLKHAPSPSEAATSLASNSTKIPKAGLEAVSTPEGRQVLNDAVAAHPEKINDLVSLANNPSKIAGIGSPIESAVRAPEGAAAKIDINPTLKAFDDAKISPTDFGGDASLALKVNAALDREKAAMMGELATPPKAGADKLSPLVDQYGGNIITPGKPAPPPPSPLVDPNKFRQIKTMIGKSVPWDSPEYKPFQSAMARVYSKMDQELTGAVAQTQGPEVAAQYQKDLADWSQKINDFKELQSRLGKVPSNQLNRADALLKSGSKIGNSDLLERIDQQAGTDFSGHSKNLDLAREFKDQNNPMGSGNPSWYPKGGVWSAAARIGIPMAVGERVAGPIGGGAGAALGLGLEALSSPGVAARAIPAARAAAAGIKGGIQYSPEVAALINYLETRQRQNLPPHLAALADSSAR